MGGISQEHITHFLRHSGIGGIGQVWVSGWGWLRVCAESGGIGQEYVDAGTGREGERKQVGLVKSVFGS